MRRLAWVLGMMAMGCGASGISDTSDRVDACVVGEERDCDCDAGKPGVETCTDTGWGACVCAPGKGKPSFDDDGGDFEDDGPAVCGDFRCDSKKGESCEDCPMDCGECPTCDLAPTCTGAFSVPFDFERLPEFDNEGRDSFGSGEFMGTPPEETTCTAPRLKIQLSKVIAHRDGLSTFGTGGFKIFCIVEATDNKDMELVLTEKMDLEGDGKSQIVSGTNGIFWGQGTSTVKQSQFHLTLNYNCYRDQDGNVWKDVLDGVSKAAGAGAGIPGNPYGWAFGLGSVAAAAAKSAIQDAGLTNVLSIEQRIHKDALLLLTQGKTWSIRQSGKFKSGTGSEKSDVELVIRAWGCSTPKPLPPQ